MAKLCLGYQLLIGCFVQELIVRLFYLNLVMDYSGKEVEDVIVFCVC